ncbi:MAG: 5-methyltetrahydropteroyltriglutamate--homocysteine methyltransferase, partial [Lachnospiraceae bacterium]|nr:5-methyltetrahydropteroyltriglutamate--homocysteine methyltransferase [Lachnospiraceae bacterium]
MSKIRTPYRYDFVGSFLRPQALKDAKAAYQAGDIGEDELEQVMQREIARIVEKQKELGFHVITDGEFRRTFWHLDFMWGFEGVEHKATGKGVQFNGVLAVL